MTTAGAIGNIAQTIKRVGVIFPQAIKDNTEWVGSKGSTPVSIDTAANGIKADYMTVSVMIGATDIAVATMKLWESDDDSTYATADNWATSGTLPAATDDNKFFAWDVDCRSGKRYYQVELIAGNGTVGTYAACWADLFCLRESPNTDAERGYAQTVKVS